MSLETFIRLHQLVLDRLAVFETAKPFALDAGVVDEYIFPFLGPLYKTKTFLAIKPFDGAGDHRRRLRLATTGVCTGPPGVASARGAVNLLYSRHVTADQRGTLDQHKSADTRLTAPEKYLGIYRRLNHVTASIRIIWSCSNDGLNFSK